MHLTNYAINKDHVEFEQNQDKNNTDVGHKRDFQSVLDCIESEKGKEAVDKVEKGIYDIIIKTLTIAQPMIKHYYHSC